MARKRIVYTPAALVVADVLTPVAAFSAVIVAPTTTAPLGSVTRPVMEPVTVCPSADHTQNRARVQNAAKWRNEFLLINVLFSMLFGRFASGIKRR